MGNRVVRVIDGDTVECARCLTQTKFVVRLLRIDAPELRPRKDTPFREKHMAAGQKAKEFLAREACGRRVTLLNPGAGGSGKEKYDQYKRRLAEVVLWRGKRNLSDLMLAHGLARQYDGKTKRGPWTEAELDAVLKKPT